MGALELGSAIMGGAFALANTALLAGIFLRLGRALTTLEVHGRRIDRLEDAKREGADA